MFVIEHKDVEIDEKVEQLIRRIVEANYVTQPASVERVWRVDLVSRNGALFLEVFAREATPLNNTTNELRVDMFLEKNGNIVTVYQPAEWLLRDMERELINLASKILLRDKLSRLEHDRIVLRMIRDGHTIKSLKEQVERLRGKEQ